MRSTTTTTTTTAPPLPPEQAAEPNAFALLRPRSSAVAANDAVAPRCGGNSRGAATQGTTKVLVLNRRGLRVVDLAPRVQGAISIESRAQAQASLDKSRRIARDWRQ